MLEDLTLPVYRHYLDRLDALVEAAQRLAVARALDPAEVCALRLAPDMLPFGAQIAIAANFAVRACYPLAGRPVPPSPELPRDLAAATQCIARARELLAALGPADFHGAEQRVLEERAGEALVRLPATDFLMRYALPNFFFHHSAAYNILRQAGADIGKADFDGWHVYPR